MKYFLTFKWCHNSKPHNKTENEINMGTLSWYEKGTSVTSLSEKKNYYIKEASTKLTFNSNS